jgi:aminocarboxymuconate-semialdehyde decarboxylase
MRAGDAPDGIRLAPGSGIPWVEHRQGYRYPLLDTFHDVEARLASMDGAGIDHALLSAAPPLFLYWIDAAEAADAARTVNDAIVDMARLAPERFSAVATLPLQDPDAAVTELRRCLSLGVVAAQIGPHCEGIPLDGDVLRPVLRAAAEAGLPVILHLSGALDELPSLECVLVHGGGHLPYQIGRLDHGHRVRPEAARPQHSPSTYLRRFHYDSLTHRPQATGWLLDQVGDDRVLFGTDTPFDMGGGSLDEQLHGLQLPDDVLAAVGHRNAERLFGPSGGHRT